MRLGILSPRSDQKVRRYLSTDEAFRKYVEAQGLEVEWKEGEKRRGGERPPISSGTEPTSVGATRFNILYNTLIRS